MAISYRMGKNPYTRGVRVAAVSDTGEDVSIGNTSQRVVPFGAINVYPPREDPNFWANRNGLGTSFEYEQYNSHRPLDDPLRRSPSELFTHVSPQIHEAFVDPSLRHTLPTMVGIAMNELNAEHDVPMADNSLTRWSGSLSQKAAARGLAVPHFDNPDMQGSGGAYPRNQMLPDNDAVPGIPADWHSHVPPEKVKAGQQWVRSRLRQSKAVRGESQFGEDPRSESQREWGEQRINPGPGQEPLF